MEDKCVLAQQFSLLGGCLHIIVLCGWIHNASTHKVYISGERYVVLCMLYHLVDYVRPYKHVNI